jgi:Ca2+-binding EF-hand superfamily protein
MTLSRRAVCGLAVALPFALPLTGQARGALYGIDTDHDGSIDLDEAKAAASKLFDQLDTDHDGTLTRHELWRQLGPDGFRRADTDHDGTLSKDEYLALVAFRFHRADRRGTGVLKPRDLNSAAGVLLLKLLH